MLSLPTLQCIDHLLLPGLGLLLGGGRQHGGTLLLLPLHRLDSSLLGLIAQTLGEACVQVILQLAPGPGGFERILPLNVVI